MAGAVDSYGRQVLTSREFASSVAPPRRARGIPAGLACWFLLVVASIAWPALSPLDESTGIAAAPFYGRWTWHAQLWLAPVAMAGALVIGFGPRLAGRLSARQLPVVTGAAATAWVTIVAAADGWSRVGAPLFGRHQYLPFATRLHPAAFVDGFVGQAARLPTHVKGHPPGATLAFWFFDRIGLDTPALIGIAVAVAWGAGIGSIVWTVRDVGGAEAARHVAPFLVLLPAVVWAGTSADALFMGVSAVAIACLVAATSRADRRATVVVAAAGGLLFGIALHLTYGVVPLLVVPLLVAHRRRRWSPLVVGAVGAGLVASAFVAAGFWWFDGLAATRGFYAEGLARVRPYGYFVLAGNLGAVAFAAGPAVAGGLGAMVERSRRHPELLIVAGAGIAMLTANLSGLSKGEVERIWLPFVPWLAVGVAALPSRRTRGWLAAQLALTLGLQAFLVTPW